METRLLSQFLKPKSFALVPACRRAEPRRCPGGNHASAGILHCGATWSTVGPSSDSILEDQIFVQEAGECPDCLQCIL